MSTIWSLPLTLHLASNNAYHATYIHTVSYTLAHTVTMLYAHISELCIRQQMTYSFCLTGHLYQQNFYRLD